VYHILGHLKQYFAARFNRLRLLSLSLLFVLQTAERTVLCIGYTYLFNACSLSTRIYVDPANKFLTTKLFRINIVFGNAVSLLAATVCKTSSSLTYFSGQAVDAYVLYLSLTVKVLCHSCQLESTLCIHR